MLFDDINAQLTDTFDVLETAVSLRDAISQPLKRNTHGFIVPVAERPDNNNRDEDVGRPMQEVLVTFGIVIGLQSINDATGSKGLSKLEVLRYDVRQGLFGYQPAGHSPILLGTSDLISFVKSGLFWVDRFTTRTWREAAQPYDDC